MSFVPFSRRMEERKLAASGSESHLALTDRDERNIREFDEAVRQLTAVLQEESEVVSKCDLDTNQAVFSRKQALVQQMDRLAPMLEPFLPAVLDADEGFRARVAALAEQVRENEALLSRLSQAAQSIATEHARIVERHSLNGLYAKTGKKRGTSQTMRAAIDEQH